jgi:hypothetical protein
MTKALRWVGISWFGLFALMIGLGISLGVGLEPVSAEPTESSDKSDVTTTNEADYVPAELTAQIVDPNNVLSESKAEVQDALDRVWVEAQEKLYVIFLPRFDGATTPDEWIDKTAELTGLTANSVIYAVAYEAGQLTVFIPDNSVNLSVSNLNSIASAAGPYLETAAWGDSVKAVAESIISQTVVPPQNYFLVLIVIIAVGLAIAGYLVYFFVFRKKRKAKKTARRATPSFTATTALTEEELIQATENDEAVEIVSELVQNPEVIDPSVTSTDVAAVKLNKWMARRRERKDLPARKNSSGRRRK